MNILFEMADVYHNFTISYTYPVYFGKKFFGSLKML